jgi:hypothetical protein
MGPNKVEASVSFLVSLECKAYSEGWIQVETKLTCPYRIASCTRNSKKWLICSYFIRIFRFHYIMRSVPIPAKAKIYHSSKQTNKNNFY